MQPTDRGPTSDSWLLTAAPSIRGRGYYYFREGKVLFSIAQPRQTRRLPSFNDAGVNGEPVVWL
jgi:hypothetical protein